MAEIKQIEIRCTKCKKWFASPIVFGETKSFDSSCLEGNLVQCQHCKKMTGCNKENMRTVLQKAVS